jgi:hypothetical protein
MCSPEAIQRSDQHLYTGLLIRRFGVRIPGGPPHGRGMMDQRFDIPQEPKTRAVAELLIDCEKDRTLRAVLVGMLREMHP